MGLDDGVLFDGLCRVAVMAANNESAAMVPMLFDGQRCATIVTRRAHQGNAVYEGLEGCSS
jgi:hypothetical protein